MNKLLILFLAISSSVFADYTDYIYAGTNADGAEFFYDPDTIVKDGQIVRAWEYVNYASPLSMGAKSGRFYRQYDCKNRTYEILNVAVYS